MGLHAKNRLLRLPTSTVSGVKRLLGSGDPSKWSTPTIPCEATSNEATLEFTVNYDDDNGENVEKKVTTEQLLTFQLGKLHGKMAILVLVTQILLL